MYHSNLLSVSKTLEIINKLLIKSEKEDIFLIDGNSRVLAQDIIVNVAVPPFNRSAMDGYAVISEDLANASPSKPIYLNVIDEIGAGNISNHILISGNAIRIATGAQMPIGSDAVVMEENVHFQDEKIKITSSVSFNQDVSMKGEDLKEGEVILLEGQILGPHHLAVIASAGHNKIKVFKQPKIGVIITGNELEDPSADLNPGMIINSNKYALKGVIEDSMAISNIKNCQDNREKLIKEVKNNIDQYDAVITTGGTAISKGDLIVEIVEELGEVPVHGVSIKPGKPFGFGIIKQKPIFMLSGYPVAVAVQYDILVRDFILKMQNINNKFDSIKAIAGADIRSSIDKYNVIRAEYKEDEMTVYPIRTKAGINKSILISNCYIIAEEGIGKIKKGDDCMILKYSSLKVK
jgi:molybdopterin molybdotransferase